MMGGYGDYIWTAYTFVLVVLISYAGRSLWKLRRVLMGSKKRAD